MFFDQGKSNLSSTQQAVAKSAIKSAPKKKDNFVVFSFKKLWSLLVGFWTRFRKCMWVGSTGNFVINTQALSSL